MQYYNNLISKTKHLLSSHPHSQNYHRTLARVFNYKFGVKRSPSISNLSQLPSNTRTAFQLQIRCQTLSLKNHPYQPSKILSTRCLPLPYLLNSSQILSTLLYFIPQHLLNLINKKFIYKYIDVFSAYFSVS